MGRVNPRPRSGIGQAGRLSLRVALSSVRDRRPESCCLWTGQENVGGDPLILEKRGTVYEL